MARWYAEMLRKRLASRFVRPALYSRCFDANDIDVIEQLNTFVVFTAWFNLTTDFHGC